MALKATVFKAGLNVADMDRHYYADHDTTLARHPSETDERMMVRLLAFARHAGEQLQFTRGLCADDEPDLWQKSYSGEIELWIDVGLPDLKRIRKACARAKQVVIYAYGGRQASLWWEQIAAELGRFEHLSVYNIPKDASATLAEWAERTMQLQCTLQEGRVWVSHHDDTLEFDIEPWKESR